MWFLWDFPNERPVTASFVLCMANWTCPAPSLAPPGGPAHQPSVWQRAPWPWQAV